MIYEEKLIQCSIVTPKGVLKDVPCDLVLKDSPPPQVIQLNLKVIFQESLSVIYCIRKIGSRISKSFSLAIYFCIHKNKDI